MDPKQHAFKSIPLKFENADHYWECMFQNNLAEYWAFLEQAVINPSAEVAATRISESELLITGSGDSEEQVDDQIAKDVLLKVNGRYHIVVMASSCESKTLLLTGVRADIANTAELLKAALEQIGIEPLSVLRQEAKQPPQKKIVSNRNSSSKQKIPPRRPPLFYVRIPGTYRGQGVSLPETVSLIRSHGIAHKANVIDGSPDAASAEDSSNDHSTQLTVVPPLAGGKKQVQVEVLGFIGTWLQQHLTIESFLQRRRQEPATVRLRSLLASAGGVEGRRATSVPPPVLQSIMDPSSYREGVYDTRSIDKGYVVADKFIHAPCNKLQEVAVAGISHDLEIIQGPPGTGKSAMILHILRSRVPTGQVTLVTSVCNQAIGSVCEKLGRFHSVSPLLVLGNPKRVASAAVPFTIKMQVENHPEVKQQMRYIEKLGDLYSTLLCLLKYWKSVECRWDWSIRYEKLMDIRNISRDDSMDGLFGYDAEGSYEEHDDNDDDDGLSFSNNLAKASDSLPVEVVSQRSEATLGQIANWWAPLLSTLQSDSERSLSARLQSSGISDQSSDRRLQASAKYKNFKPPPRGNKGNSKNKMDQKRKEMRRKLANALWAIVIKVRFGCLIRLRDMVRELGGNPPFYNDILCILALIPNNLNLKPDSL